MRTVTRSRTRALAVLAAVFAVVALVLPAGVGHAEEAPAQKQPKQLVVAASQSVDTFNPFMSFFAIGYTVAGLTYDSLIDWSAKDFRPIPAWPRSGRSRRTT